MFIASLLAVILNSALVHGAVLCVQPTGELQTLRAALSKANDNDTILVASGTYCEWNLIAAKSVTILGEGETPPLFKLIIPRVTVNAC